MRTAQTAPFSLNITRRTLAALMLTSLLLQIVPGTAWANDGGAQTYVFDGPTTVSLNVAFSMTITAVKSGGSVAKPYNNLVSVTVDNGTVTPTQIQPASWSNGVATVSFTVSGPMGARVLRLTDATQGAITNATVLNAGPGPFDHITVLNVANGQLNVPLSFVAEARDASENLITSYNAAATYSASPSGGFSPTTPNNFVNGVSTTSVTFSTTGARTMTIVSGGKSATSNSFTINSGLNRIAVTPATSNLVAGATASFTATGYDGANNPIALGSTTWSTTCGSLSGQTANSATLTARQLIGGTSACGVTATSGGKTDTASVTLIPGPASSIALSPSSPSVVAGSTQQFTGAVTDQYGNTVAPSITWTTLTCGTISASGLFTAPVGSGVTCTVRAQQGSAVNTASATIVAGPLASITVTPSNPQVAAGASRQFSATGADANGNSVTFSPVWSAPTCGSVSPAGLFTAPNGAGVSCPVTASASGVSGSSTASIVAGPLASITVTPAAPSVVAAKTRQFAASGADSFGNPVSIAPSWTTGCGAVISATGLFTAPTSVGTCIVTATESGINGQATVTVVADVLDRISVSGANSMVVGTTGTYTFAGFDQHNNPVTLSTTSSSITAPTSVGTGSFVVSTTQSGITGTKTVALQPDALHRIDVSGVGTMVVGTTSTFTYAGFDRYDNGVTLATTSESKTAPTLVGPGSFTVSTTQSGITGSKTVTLQPDALAVITVAGPSSIVAMKTGTFTPSGTDQYGNTVTLAASTFDVTAARSVGTGNACYSEVRDGQTIQGCKSYDVVHDVLASIAVSGPASLVAGTSATYTFAGSDQYGNAVPLSESSRSVAAPTLVSNGPVTVSLVESGITGSMSVTVTHDVLATIDVSGPPSIVAGKSALFGFSGKDQYGNPVPLSESSRSVAAPQRVTDGPVTVSLVQDGVTGSTSFSVTADELHHITLGEPASAPVAGQTMTLDVFGFDQYDNPVSLSATTVTLNVPTGAGEHTLIATLDGKSKSVSVTVVADVLDHIELSRASLNVVAGSTSTFDVAGFDQYENPVVLSASTVDIAVPTTAGPETLSATVDGKTDQILVMVIAAPLHRIVVDGPTSVLANTDAAFTFEGFDQYDNPVALDETSRTVRAPKLVADGPITVSLTQDGVTGSMDFVVLADALHTITVEDPTVPAVAGKTLTLAASGFDQYGNPVPLSATTLTFDVPTQAGERSTTAALDNTAVTITVTVVPDALDRIRLSRDDLSLVAGTVNTFDVEGFDQYDNKVDLSSETLDLQAPTAVGSATLTGAVDGVDGTIEVLVIADVLDHIELSRASLNVVAGSTSTFDVAGFDQYENPVVLSASTIDLSIPTAVGPATLTGAIDDKTNTIEVNVIADALDEIVVDGPTSVLANTDAVFTFEGFDQYGNPVALDETSRTVRAPKLVADGPITVSQTQDGITGSTTFDVLAHGLHEITVEAPTDPAVAGTTLSLAPSGFDQYGNPVPVSATTLTFDVPTQAGERSTSATLDGKLVTVVVTVIADALHHIVLSAESDTFVAGSTATLSAAGFDQYDNPVDLSASSVDLVVPTQAGAHTLETTIDGVDATYEIGVIPDVLHSLVLTATGAPYAAGSTATLDVEGFDQYGNLVTLSSSTASVQVPTTAGTHTLSVTVGGITETIEVSVVAGPLSTISLTAPAASTLQAGTSAVFTAAGYDAYGNPVTLSSSTVTIVLPTTAGPATVTGAVDGASASVAIVVLPGPLALVTLSDPSTLVAGSTAVFAARGEDQYGNAVTLSSTTVSITLPQVAGTHTLQKLVDGVQASVTVLVKPGVLAAIQLAPATSTLSVPTYPAGSSATFRVYGYDAFGNEVPVLQNSYTTTVCTVAGPCTVSHSELNAEGVTVRGSLTVTVVAGPATRAALSPSTATVPVGGSLTLVFSASDTYGNAVSPSGVSWSATAGKIVNGVFTATTPGSSTVTATIDGLSARATITSAYSWSNVLSPIRTDGSSVFKQGSTIPVKFQLRDGSASITNLQAKIYLAQVSSNVVGSELEATSTSAADSGNTFRYSSDEGGQYIFNLATKSLSAGTWRIRIDLGDGTTNTVLISLKK